MLLAGPLRLRPACWLVHLRPAQPSPAQPCPAPPAAYRDLVLSWLAERYTLRYSGGLVPDLHHILSKASAECWCWVSACAPVCPPPLLLRAHTQPSCCLRLLLLLLLLQGGGVFCNPTSPSAPPKLRLLYETLPLALVTEAAGGSSHDDSGGSGACVLVMVVAVVVVAVTQTGEPE